MSTPRSPSKPICATESRFVTTTPMTLLIQEVNRMTTQAFYTVTSISNGPGQGKPAAKQAELPVFTYTLPLRTFPLAYFKQADKVVINDCSNSNDIRPVLNLQAYQGWNLYYNLSRGVSADYDTKSEKHVCQITQKRDWGCRTILYADIRDASGGGGRGGSSSSSLIGKGEKKRIVMRGYWTWNWGEKHAAIYLEGGGEDGDDLKIARIRSRGGPSINQEDNSYEVEIPVKVDYGLVEAMCLAMDDVYRGRQVSDDMKYSHSMF